MRLAKLSEETSILQLAKSFGWEALEIQEVESYFKNLIYKLRDRNTRKEERTKFKKIYHKFTTALAHHESNLLLKVKPKIFNAYFQEVTQRAKQIYTSTENFCSDYCEKKRCEKFNNKKENCSELKEYLLEKYKDNEIEKLLSYGNDSTAARTIICRKFKLRPEQYSRYVELLDLIKSVAPRLL